MIIRSGRRSFTFTNDLGRSDLPEPFTRHAPWMRDGIFLGSEAIARGEITPSALRGRAYQRILPNVFAPSALQPDLAVRSRAAYLWARGHGVLTGHSAAEMWSARCAPREAAAELTIPGRHVRAPAGVRIHQVRLRDDERTRHAGVELTTPRRTAYDLARLSSLTEAVVALDALAGRFGFAPDDVQSFAERYPGARGSLRLPEVVGLADPRAESAMESRVGMVLVRAGLPPPEVQYTIVDDRGRMVATMDLAYPGKLIAIEYEGAGHFARERVLRDGYRYTRLAALGWLVHRYFASDVYNRPEVIVNDIHTALTTHAIPPHRRTS
jgi:hypothetical protein